CLEPSRLRQSADPVFRKIVEQTQKNAGSGERVIRRAMTARNTNLEISCHRIKAMTVQLRYQSPGKIDCVKMSVARTVTGKNAIDLTVEQGQIEICVVRNQDRVGDEVEERVRDFREPRR